ncbi:OmpH family outer membrane protein [Fretibacter rubidus]|uniref:OmpH family outer membrane protein n=1 Tax=Fretibacter rubidus TaxID=570162 RepID=UPI00352B22B0
MSIFTLTRRAVFGVIAMFAVTTAAYAQSTILVVDQARVIRESAVGKHIASQLKSIGTSMESELKAKASPIESERDRLVNELKNMDQNALKSRPDLQKRAQDLMTKGQQTQVEAQYLQRELQITEAKAMQKVNERMAKILEAIVAERGADIIVDRQLVIYGGKTADITDTVKSRLDSQMRTVSVIRERLPRQ